MKNVENIMVKNFTGKETFCMSLYKYSKPPVHRGILHNQNTTPPEYNKVSIIEKTKYDLLPLVLGLL